MLETGSIKQISPVQKTIGNDISGDTKKYPYRCSPRHVYKRKITLMTSRMPDQYGDRGQSSDDEQQVHGQAREMPANVPGSANRNRPL